MARLTASERESLDRAVLVALLSRCDEATYVIRNILDWPGKPFHRKGLLTSDILRACRRLEKKALIAEGRSQYAIMKTWRITPAGRLALEQSDRDGGRDG